jgi:hypothetical protein
LTLPSRSKRALYFPPPLTELHERFEPIADRLREIALCLDVTDSPPLARGGAGGAVPQKPPVGRLRGLLSS